MSEIARLEMSPGTITIKPCPKCGQDAFTYDTVALRDTGQWGVAWAGTNTRCGNCNPTV